jgi:hypothetical protein
MGPNDEGLAAFNGAVLQIPNTINLLTYEEMKGYDLSIFRTSLGVFGRYDLVQAKKLILRPHVGFSIHADRYTLAPPLTGEEKIFLKTYYSLSARIGYDFGISLQIKESSTDRVNLLIRLSRDIYLQKGEWYTQFVYEKPYLPVDIGGGVEYTGEKVNVMFTLDLLSSYSKPGWLPGTRFGGSVGVSRNF